MKIEPKFLFITIDVFSNNAGGIFLQINSPVSFIGIVIFGLIYTGFDI